MRFDNKYGYFVKSTDEEGINSFCTELVDEAQICRGQVMGKYDEVYLIATPDTDIVELVNQYNQELDRIAHHDYTKNGEGYTDLTAYEGITNAEKHFHRVSAEDRERHKKLLGCIFRICELSDFSIEERIVVRDKKTGKIWR